MIPTNTVVIELTEKDAALFEAFRRFQSNFSALNECGFFLMRGGSAVVHFDHEGVIRKVEAHHLILKK